MFASGFVWVCTVPAFSGLLGVFGGMQSVVAVQLRHRQAGHDTRGVCCGVAGVERCALVLLRATPGGEVEGLGCDGQAWSWRNVCMVVVV
jgi:hypothetical protein